MNNSVFERLGFQAETFKNRVVHIFFIDVYNRGWIQFMDILL